MQSFYVSWLKIVSGVHEGPHSWMSWGPWISGKICWTKNTIYLNCNWIILLEKPLQLLVFQLSENSSAVGGLTFIVALIQVAATHHFFCPSMQLLRSYLLFSSKLLLKASSRPPLFIFNFVRVQASLNSFVIISTHSCLTFCSKVPQTNQAINFCNRSYFSSFTVFVFVCFYFVPAPPLCSLLPLFCIFFALCFLCSVFSLFCIFFVLCFNQNLPSQFVGMALSFCLANSIRKECEIVWKWKSMARRVGVFFISQPKQ